MLMTIVKMIFPCLLLIYAENHFYDFNLFYAGMNTGIQDAHNLAWKIASVIKGVASSSILATYEIERKPVLLQPFQLLSTFYFVCQFFNT